MLPSEALHQSTSRATNAAVPHISNESQQQPGEATQPSCVPQHVQQWLGALSNIAQPVCDMHSRAEVTAGDTKIAGSDNTRVHMGVHNALHQETAQLKALKAELALMHVQFADAQV